MTFKEQSQQNIQSPMATLSIFTQMPEKQHFFFFQSALYVPVFCFDKNYPKKKTQNRVY